MDGTEKQERVRDLISIAPELFGLGPEDDPKYFPMAIGHGWFELIGVLLFQIHQKWKRWGDVVEIQKGIPEGEEEPDWIGEYFEKHPENPLRDLRVSQIKQKFGGLRFYLEGTIHDPEIEAHVRGLVQMAEAMSYRICEVCGNSGFLRRGKWSITLCNGCHLEYKDDIP